MKKVLTGLQVAEGKMLPKTPWTEALLRRAIYAEQRVVETEFMLGEMALICEGAKQRVGELEAKLDEVLKVT